MHLTLRAAQAIAAPVLLVGLAVSGCGDSTGTGTPSESTPEPLPTVLELPQEGETHGVVLFPGRTEAEREASIASIAELDEVGLPSDVRCFGGAAEALGLDEQVVISLVFDDAADARRFAEAYTERTGLATLGAAEVQTYCLDG